MPTPPDVQTIRHRLAQHADELRAMGVERAAVFGSVARGDAGPDSDVDLLVTLRPEVWERLNLIQLAGLSLDIGDRIEAEVQVTPTGRLSRRFLDTISDDLVDVFH